MSDWLDVLLCALALICLVLPPKYDPAIRWKEWLEGRHDRR